MGLFRCKHDYRVISMSNVLDINNFGAVTRLCRCECEKCGKTINEWCDVSVTTIRELDNGKSVLAEWMPVEYDDNHGGAW